MNSHHDRVRAPATYPDEPEPEPTRRTVHWRSDATGNMASFDWPPGQPTFTCTTTAQVAGPYMVIVEYE